MDEGLIVSDARVSYGRVRALVSGELRVRPGQMVALVGPNGAGKSTLLRFVTGVIRGEARRLSFDGENIEKSSVVHRARHGLVLVPQGRQLFPRLTVRENLQLVADALKLPAERIDVAFERFPILKERARMIAGSLSGGEQQMLALSRGLMCEPKVLLLDEPTLGLAPSIVDEVMTEVSRLCDGGLGVLIAEPSMHLLPRVLDGGFVLVRGRAVAQAAGYDELANEYLEQMGMATSESHPTRTI
jgi:branched-chain amino acid transport system ATP-binding protein